jgi:hypothetical protein
MQRKVTKIRVIAKGNSKTRKVDTGTMQANP